jgi:cephalosporin-C deacetylase-like acetyl esterase
MSLADLEKCSSTNWAHTMKDQLREHIYARSRQAFAQGEKDRDAVTTPQALEERQKRSRQAYIDGIGGLPAMDTPLNARTVGVVEEDGFKIEKVIFESRPANYVTANLYIPSGLTGPTGAVLFACGHHNEAKHVAEYQVVCRHMVKAGLVVLAFDPIGQGERYGYFEKQLDRPTILPGSTEHDYSGAQCLPLGDSLARYFTHDAMRVIDYLITRPEVNAKKIGMTGNSGGGLQTVMLMLADPRLAALAPCTFVMSREVYMEAGGVQDAEQIFPGYTSQGFDHEDFLLTVCPKPVCVLAVTSDFFPIEGTRRTVERCKRVWSMMGRPGDLELVEDVSIHIYTPVLARAVSRFFAKHMLSKDVTVDSSTIKPIDPKLLWCTQSSHIRAEIDGARGVYDENQVRLAELEKARAKMPEFDRKTRATKWLGDAVHAGRKASPVNIRVYHNIDALEELTADLGYWWSQEKLFNEGLLFRSALALDKKLPVTIALWEGAHKAMTSHLGWVRKTCGAGRAVLVVSLSGMGAIAPHPLTGRTLDEPLGTLHKFANDLAFLNDSVCALRTYDMLRALEALGHWPGVDTSDVKVYTEGRCGVYAELAAALEPRLARLETKDPLPDFKGLVTSRYFENHGIQALMLPGILKYTDLPELRRWRQAQAH